MITEFTSGSFNVRLTPNNWELEKNTILFALISHDGLIISFTNTTMSAPDLIEIAVLMNNIKRQYTQLQVS